MAAMHQAHGQVGSQLIYTSSARVLNDNGTTGNALPADWVDWLRQRPMAFAPNGGVKPMFPSWNGMYYVTWTLQAGNGSHTAGANWFMNNFPTAVKNYTAAEHAAFEQALGAYSDVCGLVFAYNGINNGWGYRTNPPLASEENGGDVWHWSPMRLPPGQNNIHGYQVPASLIARIQNWAASEVGMMATGTLGTSLYDTGQPNPRFQDATINANLGQKFAEVRLSYTGALPALGVDGLNVATRDLNYRPGSNGFMWMMHELGHALGMDHMNRRSPSSVAVAPLFPGLESIEATAVNFPPINGPGNARLLDPIAPANVIYGTVAAAPNDAAGQPIPLASASAAVVNSWRQSARGILSNRYYARMPGLFGLNNTVASVMSYRANGVTNQRLGDVALTSSVPNFNGAEQGALGFPKTPMAFDVINLQMFYGINSNKNRGNNVYNLPDAAGPALGWACIWDAGGIDTIAAPFEGDAGVEIDLRNANMRSDSTAAAGTYSRVYNVTGGFTIAYDWDGRTLGDDVDGINAGINVIERAVGGLGNDRIIANRLPNRLRGRGGNDTYILQLERDRVVEIQNEGFDTIETPVSCSLPPHVERLVLKGSDNIDATGNNLDNEITGNSGNNVIRSGGGNRNTLRGGSGNDTYYISRTGDLVEENGSEGYDKIFVTASTPAGSTFTLGAGNSVEEVEILGSENLNVTAGNMANLMIGNRGNNILSGMGGDDVLNGASGDDVLIGGNDNDLVYGGRGRDALSGGFGRDRFVFPATTDHGLDFEDHILDFNHAHGDTIEIVSGGAFPNTTDAFGERPLFAAVLSSEFLQDAFLTRILIVYDRSTGYLHYNRNGITPGTGITNNEPFAKVNPGQVLQAADFRLLQTP